MPRAIVTFVSSGVRLRHGDDVECKLRYYLRGALSRFMKVAASKGHQFVGILMVAAALIYLVPFVPRGWIPHDEGMLGQSAERVLQGDIPHIDYEEAYTGGLSWLYAAVFKVFGIDLLHLRWFLFAGAAAASWLTFAILRRFLAPAAAGLATWIALAWSFPNYFAGLPSWWLLVCALACLWAVIRYVETGQWHYVAAGGLAAGTAIAIKQTGVYLLVALVLSLFYAGARSRSAVAWLGLLDRWGQWIVATVAIIAAATLLWPRIFGAEGLYLFLPAAACAILLLLPTPQDSTSSSPHTPLALVCIATAVAALPLLCLLIPYVIQDRVWDFVNGSVFLPRKRLAFASTPMPGASSAIAGLPLMALVFAAPRFGAAYRSTPVKVLLWVFAILLPLVAVRSSASYQLIWQSSRAFAALLPLGIAWSLASGRVRQPEQRAVLFAAAAMLAWTSLNQFPFAAPIYFCYIAPLAVIAGIAAASAASSLRRTAMLPWATMLLMFAVISANRGYLDSLGTSHAPRRFETTLRNPRAHLKISREDARVYGLLAFSVSHRLRGGQLVAGPDCPEVYFLSGTVNPSGRLFDFFSDEVSSRTDDDGVAPWRGGAVIVINHAPHFSPAPSGDLSERLRREFPRGEHIGRFEVRWR